MNIEQIATRWTDAWSGKDTDAFIALFADDAVYRDDQAGRVSKNHQDLHDFHSHFSAALSEISFDIVTAFQSGENACFEWIFAAAQTGEFHGRPPTGVKFKSNGVSVLKLGNDGKIHSCTDYYDGNALAEQLSGEVPAE